MNPIQREDEQVEVVNEVDQVVLVFASETDADKYGLTGDPSQVVGERPVT